MEPKSLLTFITNLVFPVSTKSSPRFSVLAFTVPLTCFVAAAAFVVHCPVNVATRASSVAKNLVFIILKIFGPLPSSPNWGRL